MKEKGRVPREEMEVKGKLKIMRVLQLKVKNFESYSYLKWYGFFSNLYEFLELCSRKLKLLLGLTILRITTVMERLKKLFFDKMTGTTM